LNRFKRKPYIPKGTVREKISFSDKRRQYRRRWKSLISANPGAARNDLVLIDSMCCGWLRTNDKEWYDRNSPLKRTKTDWVKRDDEYLEAIKDAVEQMANYVGRSQRLTVTAISKKAAVSSKIHEYLASGRLPKTKAFLDENIESREQFRKKKILWSAQTLLEQGRLNLKNLKKMVTISHSEAKKLQDFILDCIEQARN